MGEGCSSGIMRKLALPRLCTDFSFYGDAEKSPPLDARLLFLGERGMGGNATVDA